MIYLKSMILLIIQLNSSTKNKKILNLMILIIIRLIVKKHFSIYKTKQLDVLNNAYFAKENASFIRNMKYLIIVILVAISLEYLMEAISKI